jgi:hypothetical protein
MTKRYHRVRRLYCLSRVCFARCEIHWLPSMMNAKVSHVSPDLTFITLFVVGHRYGPHAGKIVLEISGGHVRVHIANNRTSDWARLVLNTVLLINALGTLGISFLINTPHVKFGAGSHSLFSGGQLQQMSSFY